MFPDLSLNTDDLEVARFVENRQGKLALLDKEGNLTAVYEDKKPFKCSICDNNFSKKGQLKRHIASVHEGSKPFKCTICEYKSSQKGHLKLHIASVHEGKKSFKTII